MSKKITPRFPEYKWYCAACHECLSDQPGFDDNKFTWKCTYCNYKNSISKDNLRKPYAFLIDQSTKSRFMNSILSTIRSIYSYLFRTVSYLLATAIIAVGLHRTDLEHLSLGLISPRGIKDYFCSALYVSGIVFLTLLGLYALSQKIIGRPNTKKHFLRETFYFCRDNLFYPINVIKAIFQKTTLIGMVSSSIALLIFLGTIALLVYGYLYLL